MASDPATPINGRAESEGLRPPAATSRMSRGEEAARYIRGLIFDGELLPGSRVPQDDIARVLGVSRIPVREALIALEREGWVTIELNRGAFVNALDAQALLDHYELYGMIFGFVARRALDRAESGELVRVLDQIVRDLGATDDPDEILQLTIAYQRTLVDSARSPRVRPMIRALNQLVPGDFFSTVPEAIDLERKGLRAITRALKRGDGEKAAAEDGRMSSQIGETVLALFERRGLITPDTGATATPPARAAGGTGRTSR
jgi:DNA-binding GntR family transcriptional regulator